MISIPQRGTLTFETFQSIFGDALVGWDEPDLPTKMDFSGAIISIVKLHWKAGHDGQAQVLVKYVDPVEALAGADPEKRTRTLRSYSNEAAMLREVPRLIAAGVRVPAVHALLTEDEPFRMLACIECCTPALEQVALLDARLSRKALGWLARFHAYGRGVSAEGAPAVWEVGGHSPLANRPAGEVDRLPGAFAKFRASFEAAAGTPTSQLLLGCAFPLPPADAIA
jgi:hypothetical protein